MIITLQEECKLGWREIAQILAGLEPNEKNYKGRSEGILNIC